MAFGMLLLHIWYGTFIDSYNKLSLRAPCFDPIGVTGVSQSPGMATGSTMSLFTRGKLVFPVGHPQNMTSEAGQVAQLVKCLLCNQEELSEIPRTV